MTKCYAYWEKYNDSWGLVVYHGEKPRKGENSFNVERTEPYIVPAEMIDLDGSPNMGLITKEYPAPPKEITIKISLEPKEELPEWAIGFTEPDTLGEMYQLYTKDSSKRGNATLAKIYVINTINDNTDKEIILLIVTDANNWIKANKAELEELFTIGKYILKEFPNPKSIDDLDALIEELSYNATSS